MTDRRDPDSTGPDSPIPDSTGPDADSRFSVLSLGPPAITDSRLDPRDCEGWVRTDADGAIVTFTGVVRDHNDGRAVTALRYEAHPRADHLLLEVVERHSGPDVRVCAQHRVGDLAIGDLAVVVAVATPHRAEAFAVCAAVIDEIKARVPIWKHERYADGTAEWVDPCGAGH